MTNYFKVGDMVRRTGHSFYGVLLGDIHEVVTSSEYFICLKGITALGSNNLIQFDPLYFVLHKRPSKAPEGLEPQEALGASEAPGSTYPPSKFPRALYGASKALETASPIGGNKYDQGKHRAGLVLGGFANALIEVSKVGTFGAEKYSEDGWLYVDNAQERYTDAMLRHHLDDARGEALDKESGLLHAAHRAWNALAVLELMLLDGGE